MGWWDSFHYSSSSRTAQTHVEETTQASMRLRWKGCLEDLLRHSCQLCSSLKSSLFVCISKITTVYWTLSGSCLDPWLRPILACKVEWNSGSPAQVDLARSTPLHGKLREQLHVACPKQPRNKNFASRICPAPKYFIWTAMCVCSENNTRSFPFREYKA